MARCIMIPFLVFVSFSLSGQPATYTPTELMLLETFYFDNPEWDVAKFESADVQSAKRQKEVKEVGRGLKEMIFTECMPVTRWNWLWLLQKAFGKSDLFSGR